MAIRLHSVSPLRLEPEAALEALDWRRVFGRDGRVEIEIGIGKGRFLLAAAAARPDVPMLGVEWANQYLTIAEERAQKRGLHHVRLVRVDARELLHRSIPAGSVSTYYVFYPIPWPKKRHHKRRFFQASTLDDLARTLVPGGCVHAATDHDEYWSVIESLLDSHAAFVRLPGFGGRSFPLPVDDAPLTNFEAKYEVQGRNRHRGSWRRGRRRGRRPLKGGSPACILRAALPRPGRIVEIAQESSSIGRAPVSKTGGCRFDSCLSCQLILDRAELQDRPDRVTPAPGRRPRCAASWTGSAAAYR